MNNTRCVERDMLVKIREWFRGKKIAHRITFLVVFAIIVIFSLATIFELNSDRAIMERELEEKMESLSNMLAISASEPLWDYDTTSITALGESAFKDREVASLQISDEISGELYQKSMSGIAYAEGDLQSITKKIYHDNTVIGELTLQVTSHYKQRQIIDRGLLRVLEIMIAVGTLTLIIAWISSRITAPLKALEEDAKRIAAGESRVGVERYRNDEIGELAQTFQYMGDSVEEAKRALQALNESLEERVNERTAELVDKNVELNEALNKLQAAQDELIKTSKMTLTAQLVAGVAHEINTPLGVAVTLCTFINGQSEKLVEGIQQPKVSRKRIKSIADEIRESSASMERNLKRTSALVNRFKQLTTDSLGQERQVIVLRDYLEDLFENVLREWIEEKLTVEIDCPPALEVEVFPGALLQIMTHLITNARDHAFREQEKGRIAIECYLQGRALHILFSDNGYGMSEDMLSHVFKPFYKGDMNQSGSGLGLAIVENVVSAKLGGTITCTSALAEGTTFHMIIPTYRDGGNDEKTYNDL